MAKGLYDNDIYDLVGLKAGCSSRTVKRVWENMQKLILSELQNNGKIVFSNFGSFSLVAKGGNDEWVVNSKGMTEKKYIEEYDFIEFAPSKKIIDDLNSITYEPIDKPKTNTKIKRNHKKVLYNPNDGIEEADYVNDIIKNKGHDPNTFEMVTSIINHKLAEKSGDANKYRRIKCLNNGKIYDSPNQARLDLDISINKMYDRIRKNFQEFEIDGYEFEMIENKFENGVVNND